MALYYLQPDDLAKVPVDGLTAEEVGQAIARAREEARINEAAAKAAKILRDANIEVDDEALERLRRLTE